MASFAPTPSLHHSFAGRRVLVTGGASGIGRGIVAAFYNDGASVFVLDRNAELLATLKAEFPNVTTLSVDLLDEGVTRAAVEGLAPLDHLVNCAGIVIPEPLVTASGEAFDKMFGVNLKAVLNVSQAFVKGVVSPGVGGGGGAGGATIVNISSTSDRVSNAGIGVYSATKAALTSLTKSMALEFAPVRVNCICPGMVPTAMFADVGPQFVEAASKMLDGRIALKHRAIGVRDIANGVLFLSSPLAEMIAGAAVVIDAGWTVT